MFTSHYKTTIWVEQQKSLVNLLIGLVFAILSYLLDLSGLPDFLVNLLMCRL